MGKRLAILTAVALAAATLSACSAYRSAIDLSTKRTRIFSYTTWEAKLIMKTTFFSDDFRQAFEQKHIDVEHLDALDASTFIADQQFRQASGWDFYVSLYTKSNYRPFTNEPDSFWKIFLTTGSGEVVNPSAVEMIPITPYEQVMFPYLTRWSKLYRVSFPKVSLGNEFAMTMQSVVGESTIKWKTNTP